MDIEGCLSKDVEGFESVSRLEAQLVQDEPLKFKTEAESLLVDEAKGDGICLYNATNK